MKTFKLIVISDSKTLFSGKILYCSVRTPSGSMGFEANHEPFLTTLEEGSDIEVKDASSKTTTLTIEKGLFSFRDNLCTITVLQ